MRYGNSYNQIKNVIHNHATEEVIVTGKNYPASEQNQMLAKVLGFLQMILLALVIAGENICKVVGINTPELVKKLQESPWLYGFLIFMIGNNVQNSLMTTGAFEIYVDGQLMHSKLETGRMPNMESLAQQLLEHGIELSSQPVRRR